MQKQKIHPFIVKGNIHHRATEINKQLLSEPSVTLWFKRTGKINSISSSLSPIKSLKTANK